MPPEWFVLAEDVGKLLARVTVSGLLIFHGIAFLNGERTIFAVLKRNGLPQSIAYLAILCEIVAPVFAILGIYARLAGLVMALFLLAGIALDHRDHLFMRGKNLAGTHYDKYFLESQVFFLVGGLLVALLGAGRFSLGIGGVWN